MSTQVDQDQQIYTIRNQLNVTVFIFRTEIVYVELNYNLNYY